MGSRGGSRGGRGGQQKARGGRQGEVGGGGGGCMQKVPGQGCRGQGGGATSGFVVCGEGYGVSA